MNTARLHQRFLLCSGVDTDTRNIRKDSMFFALKGTNFNGNEFAGEALKQGASYVVVDDKKFVKNKEHYILVQNVLESLQKLAIFHRKYLGIPILAITGSNGKTTTKELVHSVLLRKFKTIATKGNLNNHIGVPLTLLSMDDHTEFGIVEMGANHPLEIEFLCTIANPDYGYITNFGKAHLEGFGSLEGVVKAKTELYKNLQERHKLIFLNIDDEVQRKHENYNHTFSFGESNEADVQLSYQSGLANAQLNYNNTDFKSKLTGEYNAKNMAAALCIGLYFKVKFEEIQTALSNYSPDNNRSQTLNTASNTIIMDAYNANPTSMHAALENFKQLKTNKQKIAILGDMFELGSSAVTEHQIIANYVQNSDFAETYLLGDNFKNTNTSSNFIFKFKSIESLKEHLKETDFQNCYFLIKGSRGMALERVLDSIKK
ncbi:UDP-N-acetylmuramoyl-tripeptide--D-alanyl-D-alanine ligase [Christiangramia forsetii]|uniref:UDP-N-acetylmuramoyl-tripeptide--D-alanyl-D-alanine ligase n=2 Tax=Christiangramia forsetii TaxID=411153 RepID=A0M5F2_CHRFK|nr:UDP-N-acetylmuramoyl-tripeptide--D-alanyl-D-alanine ligase [Christiangramia forsetii]GGG21075.1 UDP-N-acetylmuramoyl-tripeptide--D-alanyl-D-alanine ligase [Christiangramia forsetii]CAL67847.1 UDP-N-acetylmuramoyl-tripeptide--D-alanyl-D-alanine ligase [Christiangramia forsetii KT0803]